jgi:PAS domain-containing protein
MTDKLKNAQLDHLPDSALKIIMDASPVGIIVFDRARIIYVNSLASAIFGKSETDVFGTRCGDFISSVSRHRNSKGCGYTKSCSKCHLFSAICSTLSGESNKVILEGEAFFERDADLTNIHVKYKVSSILMKGSKVAIMTIDDITDRKQAEKELRKSEKRFRSFFENSAVAVAIVD